MIDGIGREEHLSRHGRLCAREDCGLLSRRSGEWWRRAGRPTRGKGGNAKSSNEFGERDRKASLTRFQLYSILASTASVKDDETSPIWTLCIDSAPFSQPPSYVHPATASPAQPSPAQCGKPSAVRICGRVKWRAWGAHSLARCGARAHKYMRSLKQRQKSQHKAAWWR